LQKRYFYKFRVLLPVLALAIVCLSATLADPREDTNAKIKAVYLYNFSKYVEWPEDWKSGSFVVTVIGSNSSLLSELGKMAQKSVGTQQISVKSVSSASSLEHSHIVFLPIESSGMLNEVISKVKGSSTLIVTEKQGLARQGAAINFIIKDNKQAFEINKTNAERYKLKINSNLMKLGTLVE
jgi:hypothetical protein